MHEAPLSTAPPADDAWLEIDALVNELADLAETVPAARDFYAGVLERAVPALAAVGGAAWLAQGEGGWQLEYQVNLAQTGLAAAPEKQRLHARLLASALRSKAPRLALPSSGPGASDAEANPTAYLLILAPIVVEDEAVGVLEIFQRPATDPTVQRGYLRFVETLAGLAGNFHRQHRLRALRTEQVRWREVEQFAEQVHGSLDVRATAYKIANEGRRLIGCDRLGVVLRRGRAFRLVAASGVDVIDRRSAQVRRLEQLTKAVLAVDAPLWHPDSEKELPVQIDKPLQAYLEEAHARSVAVLPLTTREAAPHDSRSLGAIVVERFEGLLEGDDCRERIDAVCRHASRALSCAVAHESVPFLSLLRVLGRIGWLTRVRNWPRLALGLAIAAAVASALVLVPADFDIEGPGELQPQRRRDVFAPSDGIVSDLFVEHGDQVDPQSEKNLLAALRRPELDFEAARVSGETLTARKRLAALETARLDPTRAKGEAPTHSDDLSADVEEVKEQLASLEEQARILDQQRADLAVRPPIAGQVVTWDVHKLLESRPVKRGQKLMTIADVAGPWVVEVRLPDHLLGHVRAAQQEQGESLPVVFLVKTDPGRTHAGRIEKVALASEADAKGERSVLVTVKIDGDRIPDQRPGQSAVAKIHCGRRPIGYVWLRELWETIQTKWLF